MTGWTAPRTWTAAETVTAALMNAHVRDNLNALNGFVRKTADESVTSSTTLQNDNHLLYTIAATGTYKFEVVGFAIAPVSTIDIKIGFAFPTGVCSWGAIGMDPAIASGNVGEGSFFGFESATSGSTSISLGIASATTIFRATGVLVASATGTLQFMWAQNASSASAMTLQTGSFMEVEQKA
jgi:hypothetical protein